MEKHRKVVLYGNSVILGSIGASLWRFSRYEMTSLSPPWPDVQVFKAMAPDVILFDTDCVRSREVLSLFEILPDLMLIGLSPESHRVQVWSGKQMTELTTRDLIDVIDGPVDRTALTEPEPTEK
jgi:hypothetical protein